MILEIRSQQWILHFGQTISPMATRSKVKGTALEFSIRNCNVDFAAYDMHAKCACKNITSMEVSSARRAVAYATRNCGTPRCVSVKTLTIYIELPSLLHLRVRNIWHAGATVEELAGVFDTRHECEDAGCYVAVKRTPLSVRISWI